MNRINGFFYEYRFLSNFHLATVVLDGVRYASTEHAYQAAKILDPEKRRIFTLEFNPNLTPAQAKRVGQEIEIRPDWDMVKVSVMRDLLMQKFGAGAHLDGDNVVLRSKLRDTGDAYLEESNYWHDVFWGVCHHKFEGKTCKEPQHRPFGGNHLGYLLMDVRSLL